MYRLERQLTTVPPARVAEPFSILNLLPGQQGRRTLLEVSGIESIRFE